MALVRIGLILSLGIAVCHGAACPEGWSYVPNLGCLFLDTAYNLTWAESYTYCDLKGGYMVEIFNEEFETGMMQEMFSKGGDYWTGLTDIEEEGRFVWSHSGQELLDFQPWSPGEPNGNRSQNCVSMNREHFYFWTDDDCNLKKHPACYSPVLVLPCTRPEAFYVVASDRCYLTSDKAYNFEDAIEHCQGLGGGNYLAEVTSAEELAALDAVSDLISATFVTIGLTGNATTGEFHWLSDDPLSYTNWDSSYPTNYTGDDCVVATRTGIKWQNVRCTSNYYILCESDPPSSY